MAQLHPQTQHDVRRRISGAIYHDAAISRKKVGQTLCGIADGRERRGLIEAFTEARFHCAASQEKVNTWVPRGLERLHQIAPEILGEGAEREKGKMGILVTHETLRELDAA